MHHHHPSPVECHIISATNFPRPPNFKPSSSLSNRKFPTPSDGTDCTSPPGCWLPRFCFNKSLQLLLHLVRCLLCGFTSAVGSIGSTFLNGIRSLLTLVGSLLLTGSCTNRELVHNPLSSV